jgi:hypothetical protein
MYLYGSIQGPCGHLNSDVVKGLEFLNYLIVSPRLNSPLDLVLLCVRQQRRQTPLATSPSCLRSGYSLFRRSYYDAF